MRVSDCGDSLATCNGTWISGRGVLGCAWISGNPVRKFGERKSRVNLWRNKSQASRLAALAVQCWGDSHDWSRINYSNQNTMAFISFVFRIHVHCSAAMLLREDIWHKSSSSAFANGTIASFIAVTYFLQVKISTGNRNAKASFTDS
ncbi:hypothetical protein FH972_007925 [Carpinus fangiana]|uniref:Uncharacterized protein n=1 Tax=Carpinus fangiana TaxID=176857 RepID=A0A5N6QZD7_9ROSI|nr:hypothetical protein FH972_007925 [Carpinus fangiana]